MKRILIALLVLVAAPAVATPRVALPGKTYVGDNSWASMALIVDEAVATIATPSAVLIDKEISLGPWGLLADTSRYFNVTAIIEKPDGAGGWIATTGVETPGYEIDYSFSASPMQRPNQPGGDTTGTTGTLVVGMSTGGDVYAMSGKIPGLVGLGYPNRITRLRLYARRSATTYTGGEQATIDALGYRIRLVVNAINLVVWEREYSIPATDTSMVADEFIDLAALGLTTNGDNFKIVVDVRRNGSTVRHYLPREYTPGEAFDPPVPPVYVTLRSVFPGTQWDNSQNTTSWSAAHYYGDVNTNPVGDGPISSGIWVAGDQGYCNESTNNNVYLRIVRQGAMPATYKDGSYTGFGSVDVSTLNANLTLTVTSQFPQADALALVPGTALSFVGPRAGPGWGSGATLTYVAGVTTLQEVYDLLNAPSYYFTASALTNPTYVLQAGDVTYLPFSGLTGFNDVAVPGGSDTSTTIRVRVLKAVHPFTGHYPFEGRNDRGIDQIALRERLNASLWPPNGELHTREGGRLYLGDSRVAYTPLPISDLNATGTPSATTYLRGDGAWATPAGGAGSPGGADTQIQFNNAGAFGGTAALTYSATGVTYTPAPGISVRLTPDDSNQDQGVEVLNDGTHFTGFYAERTGYGYVRLNVNTLPTLRLENAGGSATVSNDAGVLTLAAVNGVTFNSPINGSPVAMGNISATGTPDSTTFLRGDGIWATPPGGAGAASFVEVDVDFGSGDTTASATVTGQTWVTPTTKISCSPTLYATTSRGEGEEDAILEGLTAAAHTRVNAVGFTLTVSAPNDTSGVYKFNCIGG